MSRSFNDVLEFFKSLIENGEAAAYAKEICEGRKNLTVKRVYKPRTEVNLKELPFVMMTSPSLESARLETGEKAYIRKVRLYGVLQIDNRDLAQHILTSFEEALETDLVAFENDRTLLPEGVVDLETDAAANDEGYYHPVYALVKDIKITIVPFSDTDDDGVRVTRITAGNENYGNVEVPDENNDQT